MCRKSPLPPVRVLPALCLGVALCLLPALRTALAQAGSSSSSSTPGSPASAQESSSSSAARIAQPEAGGSAITLETSEPLFDLAVALNACGYDADLASSSPVRQQVRTAVEQALAASAPARNARDGLCAYIHQHALADSSRDLAQYISLALYLSPPPGLTPTVPLTDMPPDSTQVVNVLPLVRTFADEIHLHAIWIAHRPDYDALVAHVHDPLTKAILGTNIYLGLPVSSYDGRRFLVLLEPMLAPAATNARIYSNDYVVVTSPAATPAASVAATPSVRMEDIRHTYLHYEVEPLIYARAASMNRLLPLLKPVQNAPVDFIYKSDIVALLTECLIKAIEVRTLDVGVSRPAKPAAFKGRLDLEHYTNSLDAYNRQAEAVRRKAVDLDMRQGWVLVDYFYEKLADMEHENVSLKEDIGPMVYGMDVDRERRRDEQIAFLPEASHDFVKRSPAPLSELDRAEMKMMLGDLDSAQDAAARALANPVGDHPQAHYILARIDVAEGRPAEAIPHFDQALKTSKNPRTLAWSHIYLGRLYDVQRTPDRAHALEEYRAALAVRDARPDTRAAAEQGLKQPFAAPRREHTSSDEEDRDAPPLDPSGKAEKDAYRPPPPH